MMRCSCCRQEKPETLFYWRDRARGQRRTECMDCRRKQSREDRAQNIAAVRAHDRQRNQLPQRRALNAAAARKWSTANSRLQLVNRRLQRAVRSQKLTPLPCLVCGDNAEAHHPDYSRPFDVVWLCRSHHRQLHAEHRRRLAESAPGLDLGDWPLPEGTR